MNKKIVGILLLLLGPIVFGGCVDMEKIAEEIPQRTEEAVKGTIVTAYIRQSDGPSYVWKGWGAARLYEDTGLILEFCSAERQTEEELKMRLASGTVPDIIGFSDKEQAQLYIDAGLLLPLNEYKEQLPSLFGKEVYKEALEWSVDISGGEDLLLAPLSVGKAGEQEYRAMPMFLKSAWERAGSSQVSTLEDVLDVIEQLKKVKPTSDVGESMYGICLWQGNKKAAVHTASLAYMYGIDMQLVSPLMEIHMDTGEIRSIMEEDSFFKRAVHFYYEANKRGLLDPDSPNQTAGNVERKLNSGRVLFAVDTVGAGTDNGLASLYREAYMSLPAQDMKLYLEPDHVVGTGEYLAVNKNSKHVDDVVRLLNWFYSEETMLYLYNGPEGVIWEYGKNGIPYVTAQGREILADSMAERLDLQGGLKGGAGAFGVLGRTPASLTEAGYAFGHWFWPSETDIRKEMKEAPESWNTIKASMAVYMVDTLPPKLNEIANEIEHLVYKAFWNMIYTEDEAQFEAVWQNLKEDASEIGMDGLTAFYTDAWSKALERAEELGKKD